MKLERTLNAIVSFGAVPVIIGSYFKLEHLPYASLMLGVGLITEACVFALYGIMYALGKFNDAHQSNSTTQQLSGENPSPSLDNLTNTLKKIYNLH